MQTLWQDLRFGLRLFLSSPGFTLVAVLTLAVGIAANATVFSWVDNLLLHPFPGATKDERLAVLEMVTEGAPNGANQTSYLDYQDYRQNLKSLAGLALHREDVFSLGDPLNPQPVWGELVSANYFDVLGASPTVGRLFRPEEGGEELGAHPVAVISDRIWQQRFQSSPDVVGHTLRVNQRELTIIGVAPPEFRGTMPGLVFDIWVPVAMGRDLGMLDGQALRDRGRRMLYAVARLAPGVEVKQARAEAAAFSASLRAAYPKTNRGVAATVRPVWEFHSAAPELLLQPLRILMAASVLVLLIVCANVANLLLARSVVRRKEVSIRLALGASGGRLSRQLLTETLLLAITGAGGGLLLAFWAGDALPALVPKIGVSVAAGFHLSGRILAFTTLLCVGATVFSGLAPALVSLRANVHETLKAGGRSGAMGSASDRLRGLLVIVEVTLATVTLVGAGLFLRSFQNARNIYPGFDKNNVLLARFYLAGTGYSPAQLQQFCQRLRDRLRTSSEVSDVSYATDAPLGAGAGPYTTVDVEGYVPALGESRSINNYLVAPGYFETLRIPLVEGRDFRESDDVDSQPVVIVNQSFAHRYFHTQSVLGRRVRFFGKWASVVGVAKDGKYFNVAEAPRPHFFAPYRQFGGDQNGRQLFFFLRIPGDPKPAMAALRREVAAVDSNAAAFDVMPLQAWTEVTLLPQKVAASLLSALGLVALLLAAVGLYSVMAYAVAQRTQEIGLRMALGAQPRKVLAQVLQRGLALTAGGLVAGILISLAASRIVGGLLVNVDATDPETFAGVALFLVAVSLVASYLPARRATRVDPMVALRSE